MISKRISELPVCRGTILLAKAEARGTEICPELLSGYGSATAIILIGLADMITELQDKVDKQSDVLSGNRTLRRSCNEKENQ